MPSMKFDLVLITDENKQVSMAYTSKAKAIEYGGNFIASEEGASVKAASVIRKSDNEVVHEFEMPDRTQVVEKAKPTVDGFNQGDKLRIHVVGGKFAPIVTFKAFVVVKDEDGNKSRVLLSHDLEYDRERQTPVEQIERIDVKVGARYVEYTGTL